VIYLWLYSAKTCWLKWSPQFGQKNNQIKIIHSGGKISISLWWCISSSGQEGMIRGKSPLLQEFLRFFHGIFLINGRLESHGLRDLTGWKFTPFRFCLLFFTIRKGAFILQVRGGWPNRPCLKSWRGFGRLIFPGFQAVFTAIFDDFWLFWEGCIKKWVWLVPNDTVFCLPIVNMGLMDSYP